MQVGIYENAVDSGYKVDAEIIETVVNPRNIGKTMTEGGIFNVIGFAVIIYAVILKYMERKRSKK